MSSTVLTVADHPLLEAWAFTSDFNVPLGELAITGERQATLDRGRSRQAGDFLPPHLVTTDEVKGRIRALLKAAGFKPTGRSKPASEYLWNAAAEQPLRAINPAVDCGNILSLHSGLPISVVDLDRVAPPLSIDVAEVGATYVFNPTGQVIDVGRLLCLIDAEGPCANAVKDAQRSKTDDATRRTLSVVWGSRELSSRCAEVAAIYRDLVSSLGADTAWVFTPQAPSPVDP